MLVIDDDADAEEDALPVGWAVDDDVADAELEVVNEPEPVAEALRLLEPEAVPEADTEALWVAELVPDELVEPELVVVGELDAEDVLVAVSEAHTASVVAVHCVKKPWKKLLMTQLLQCWHTATPQLSALKVPSEQLVQPTEPATGL